VEVIFFGEGDATEMNSTGGVSINEEATTRASDDLKAKL